MHQKEVAKRKLELLINEYNDMKKQSKKKLTSEETTRTWINQLLSIFDWDVRDTREILQEKTLSIESKMKLKKINSTHNRPDYTLINGTNIKSFMDAKDTSVNIFIDKQTAFQVRSYGWSAGVPCSFVTNFEQLVIFDTTFLPNPNQEANYGAVLLSLPDYLEKFDILFDHFYKENVRMNKLENIYETSAKIGNDSLDNHFNSILSDFRLELAMNLLENNKEVIRTESELNYYSQLILDRIIFIRVCESRGIEKQELLKDYVNSGFWESFKVSCYNDFYHHYDGAMFDLDSKFELIRIDNDILDKFVNGLYYPNPYKFDVVPIKTIAKIYEDFLSLQLVIKNGLVQTALKSDYIKTNGAITTPIHIVDEICRNTIDIKQLNSIGDILDLNILDPACGSGAFLIASYELLSSRMIELFKEKKIEQKYLKWFVDKNEKIYLTVEARRTIIQNCLFAIDIDEVAVEVSRMSLALKIIDENEFSILDELGVFGDKILKDVQNNIICGNTLVSVSTIESNDFINQVRPIDLHNVSFKSIFQKNGGFDYIVGNPPYVETKHYKQFSPLMHTYLKENYSTFSGKADLSILFIERCMNLLAVSGKLGFIVQKRFFKTDYGKKIREVISENKSIYRVIDFDASTIFQKRITYVAILVLSNKANEHFEYEKIMKSPEDIKVMFENNEERDGKIQILSSVIDSKPWSFDELKVLILSNELKNKFGILGESKGLLIKDGIQVLWKKMYHFTDVYFEGSLMYGTNGFGQIVCVESYLVRPMIYNRSLYPIMNLKPHAYCFFPYNGSKNNNLIELSKIKEKYPEGYKYLVSIENTLKENVNFYDDPEMWHRFTREHNHHTFSNDKIIIPMTARDTIASYTFNEGFYLDNANVWAILIEDATPELMKAVTCILNSTIFSVLATSMANPQSGGYYKLNKQFLYPVPFPFENLENSIQMIHALSDLYDRIFILQENFLDGINHKQEVLKSALNQVWKKVDEISEELYELDDSQIAIIRGIGKKIDRVEILDEVI